MWTSSQGIEIMQRSALFWFDSKLTKIGVHRSNEVTDSFFKQYNSYNSSVVMIGWSWTILHDHYDFAWSVNPWCDILHIGIYWSAKILLLNEVIVIPIPTSRVQFVCPLGLFHHWPKDQAQKLNGRSACASSFGRFFSAVDVLGKHL